MKFGGVNLVRKLWVLSSVLILWSAAAAGAAPAAKTEHRASAAAMHQTVMNRWPLESLSGTVSMVESQKDLLVVRDSNGTPFDIVVKPSTRITAGRQKENLSQLSANESVSIRFIPKASGDVAQRIDVGK